MPVTTTTAAIHIAPVVVRTFVEHARRKAAKKRQGITVQDSRDDILYDQAFHIVKAFIQLGTDNTIESLQAFTNTHVPSPSGAAVSPVVIPLSSCNEAADTLIDWFGPDELKHVVGGERWWQVRGLDGVDGEWVTEKNYLLKSYSVKFNGRKLSNDEKNILRMEHLEMVMYYIHGGGYFWGSINTHRYQVIRYARKMRGRAFTVNYRKAPQYPWPCALQDVLAGYLYLIQPPPEALHKAIPSSKIVFAGDSAGGGLSLAVLSVLRDLSLPLPGGAVLISPWVDLTHSFPSIMENTQTDIMPPHGFLAKPSTLWPIDPVPTDGGRAAPSKSGVPQKPGHPGIHKATTSRPMATTENVDITPCGIKTDPQQNRSEDRPIQGEPRQPAQSGDGRFIDEDSDIWEPRPPEVLMNNLEDVPLVLRSQIQLYATTEQLIHPLVSPILQGSLGNLPPLYILAGNEEILRDEVIYLAHRAANPAQYPVRNGILRESRRQLENAQKFTTPTKVHLQVYDGMCHVLTIFAFTDSAKFAYRSIADFVRHIALSDKEHLQCNPFPHPRANERASAWFKLKEKHGPELEAAASEFSDPITTYAQGERMLVHEIGTQSQELLFLQSQSPGESTSQDLPKIMIRERVDISGSSRAMEPEEEIEALQLRPSQIGVIREDPAKRWLEGQKEWDKRYARRARRVLKHRRRIEKRALRLMENAHNQELVLTREAPMRDDRRTSSTIGDNSPWMRRQKERRWGPLDLDKERPPPSAIAKRRDTPEALALLKKSIYDTTLVTQGTTPTLTTSDAVRAAFSRKCDPRQHQHQSASEEQVKTHLVLVHGLRMWNNVIRLFVRKTSQKALKGKKHVESTR